MSRNVRRYHRIFLTINGPGPWSCFGCGESVTELFVHHLDEDETNNDPENLVPMHNPCHTKLHHAGVSKSPLSAEHRAKLSEATRGKPGHPQSDETRHKIRVARRGKTYRQRHRAWRCGDCPMITNAGNLARHQSASGHKGKVVS